MVDKEVAESFKVWSDVSELTFQPSSSGLADIEIRLAAGSLNVSDSFQRLLFMDFLIM